MWQSRKERGEGRGGGRPILSEPGREGGGEGSGKEWGNALLLIDDVLSSSSPQQFSTPTLLISSPPNSSRHCSHSSLLPPLPAPPQPKKKNSSVNIDLLPFLSFSLSLSPSLQHTHTHAQQPGFFTTVQGWKEVGGKGKKGCVCVECGSAHPPPPTHSLILTLFLSHALN